MDRRLRGGSGRNPEPYIGDCRHLRTNRFQKTWTQEVNASPPFGGLGLKDKDTVSQVRHGDVAREGGGELALNTPVQLGQGLSAVQELRKTFVAVGEYAL